MTEDEAKTKRCCSGAAAHPQHDGMCCASACSAWRWLPEEAIVTSTFDGRAPFKTTDPAGYEAIPASWSVERLPLGGFCGLARRPE
jgi:hypothetical protein